MSFLPFVQALFNRSLYKALHTMVPIAQLTLKRSLWTSSSLYSGHSKWSTIKHKKGFPILSFIQLAQSLNWSIALLDTARGNSWAKISSRITTAVKRMLFMLALANDISVGGSDPRTNTRLEQELERAKEGGFVVWDLFTQETWQRTPSNGPFQGATREN